VSHTPGWLKVRHQGVPCLHGGKSLPLTALTRPIAPPAAPRALRAQTKSALSRDPSPELPTEREEPVGKPAKPAARVGKGGAGAKRRHTIADPAPAGPAADHDPAPKPSSKGSKLPAAKRKSAPSQLQAALAGDLLCLAPAGAQPPSQRQAACVLSSSHRPPANHQPPSLSCEAPHQPCGTVRLA
jgi:hypothetical protein